MKPGITASYNEDVAEVSSKPRCPDCDQPLTFVRTKSHQKRWYCYSCEKFTDSLAAHQQPMLDKHARLRIESLNGLQVIDSHGMIVGRVRKVVPTEAGDIKSLVLSVDKEQLKSMLSTRGIPPEFELEHQKISTVGDVVILSDVFSISSLVPHPPPLSRPSISGEESSHKGRKCSKCNAALLADAKFCIRCGTSVQSTAGCLTCGTSNPREALYCMNCGNKLS